jgi:hypothetical protein
LFLFGSALAVPQVSAQIVLGNSEGDHSLFFFEDGSPTGESFMWDDFHDHFELTDRLFVDGVVESTIVLRSRGPLQAWADVFVNWNGPDGDSHVYFYDSADEFAKYLMWDESSNRFHFNDQLDAEIFLSRHSVYLNHDGPDGDVAVNFFEGGSMTGRWLMWDNSQERFRLNDTLGIEGNIVIGTTDNVDYNLVGTHASPTSGDIVDASDVLARDLELDGQLYLSKVLYLEGSASAGEDSDQTIYFYDNDDRTENYIRWDDASTYPACSGTDALDSAFRWHIHDNLNSGWIFTTPDTPSGTSIEFKIDSDGAVAAGGSITASGSCDLAETFIGPDLEPGTVLMLYPDIPVAL